MDGPEAAETPDGSTDLPSGRRSTEPAASHDIELFRQVLARAERTFDVAVSGDRTACLLAPMLHTATCNNLAATLALAGEVDEAHDLRLRMVSKLVQHASSPSCPLPLRINCVRHMKPAISLLLSAAGDDPGLAAATLITKAQQVANDVICVAGHALGHGMGQASPGKARPAALQ